MTSYPLMRKATAVWLVENTTLTFQQIADFCGLHILEIQCIADGDIGNSIVGEDPTISGQLTKEEIKRCESDSNSHLKISKLIDDYLPKKVKAKYIPVARRQDKPDAIAWLIKHYPTIQDSQITKLIGTTKTTIESVRSKTHWNTTHLRPRDPVLLGLCSQVELDKLIRVVTKSVTT